MMTRDTRKILTIGMLADRYGVSDESLRIWERQGLIPCAMRTAGGHRRYTPVHIAALDRLMFEHLTAIPLANTHADNRPISQKPDPPA